MLAMEKARRLARGGRVALLCFNIPLAAHLAREAGGEFTVETFHAFCRRLTQRAHLPFKPPTGGEKERRFWEKDAAMLLLEALERLPDERYDAIVVDEGQNFMPDWWPCLDEALKDGREGGPPKALEILPHQLTHNCRDTTRIAKYAARLVGDEGVVKPGAPQGKCVEEITCDSGVEVARLVGERIDRLVDNEGIKPDRIAIISTRTLKRQLLWPLGDNYLAGSDRRGSR